MAPKNRGNRGHNTRSRSNSKSRARNSQAAAPNAVNAYKPVPNQLSPSRNEVLPDGGENQNTLTVESVSNSESMHNSSSMIVPQNSTCNDSNPASENSTRSQSNHIIDVFEKYDNSSNHAIVPKVSDIKEAANQTDSPPVDPMSLLQEGPLSILATELKEICSKMGSLVSIEASIATLIDKFGGLAERTEKVETKVDSHNSRIGEVEEKVQSQASKLLEVNRELASLRETVDIQGKALAKLTTIKSDLFNQNKQVKEDLLKQNKGITTEVNQLIDQQRSQVESFHSTSKRMENNIFERVEQKIEEKAIQASQEASFKALKDQAFAKRCNLIIAGLQEDDNKDTSLAVTDLFKTLGKNKVGAFQAYRLGHRRPNDNTYRRPIIVEFAHLPDRNRIWRKRALVKSEEGEQKTKIQADLPKLLRDELNILYRIKRAAANTKEFKSVVVQNYAIQLKGKEYSPFTLEQLPVPLRPSIISNPRSDVAIAFFSKYSPLSNHHPSPFTFHDQQFQNMEHYLATQRAKLSGQEDTLQRALEAADPKEAKAILRSLREDHTQEWAEKIERITIEGLKEKFSQNNHLLSFLHDTQHLQIGEASSDPRWGIGLQLTDHNVLDTAQWNPTGNLLGKCLMKVRDELFPPKK